MLILLIKQNQTKQKQIAQSKYSRSSPAEEIKLASSPYKGAASQRSFELNRPARATLSSTLEGHSTADKLTTFPTLLRVQQIEIPLENKHDHHLQSEIFYYSTLSSGQDVTSKNGQQNTLHACKATIDPDTLYLH